MENQKKYNINDDIDYVMISEAELKELVTKIAGQIDEDYPDPTKKL